MFYFFHLTPLYPVDIIHILLHTFINHFHLLCILHTGKPNQLVTFVEFDGLREGSKSIIYPQGLHFCGELLWKQFFICTELG